MEQEIQKQLFSQKPVEIDEELGMMPAKEVLNEVEEEDDPEWGDYEATTEKSMQAMQSTGWGLSLN